MPKKTHRSSFDRQAGIGTDYAVIAAGVGAAVMALIYLLLI
jgi:hypothetical protein